MGSGLFKIRARGAEGIARVLYCVVIERWIVLLRAFVKKTQATPVAEVKLARKRQKEVMKNAS
jgi:phage-related protein